MIEALKELFAIIGVLYCAGVGLMMCCMYMVLLIRLTDYWRHYDDPEFYEE